MPVMAVFEGQNTVILDFPQQMCITFIMNEMNFKAIFLTS